MMGSGPAALVFHGGPGFDHEPLVGPLAPVAKTRRLIFFDQLGCGRTPAEGPVTAEATFAHAAGVLDGITDADLSFVAFSWGATVAAAALAARSGRAVAETILINPTPLGSRDYAEMRAALSARIPAEIQAEVQRLVLAGAEGADAFALYAPYYVARPGIVVPRMSLAAMTYVTVDGSLGDFDFSAAIPRLGRIKVIRGERDHVAPRWLGAILEAAVEDIVLPGVAPYPFLEDRPAFDAALRRVLT
jgi:proline iminopeptidase